MLTNKPGPKERRLFRKKARQLDEEGLIEIERHRRIRDSRKFNKPLNDVRQPFEPQVAMCRPKNGELLTNQNQVLTRWKEHFEEHLNEGSKSEQPTRPVDLRDDGVDIGLLSREKIEGALKYRKNNKAADADSIANRCFFELRKHLQSSHLPRQTKFTIHKTLIRPVLLYGSEKC
jgi:hypothetical protein